MTGLEQRLHGAKTSRPSVPSTPATAAPSTPATGTPSLLWQPCVVGGVAHIAAGHYRDTLVRKPDQLWRYQRKQVSFDYFTPLADGWDHHRYSLAAAAATSTDTTSPPDRPLSGRTPP